MAAEAIDTGRAAAVAAKLMRPVAGGARHDQRCRRRSSGNDRRRRRRMVEVRERASVPEARSRASSGATGGRARRRVRARAAPTARRPRIIAECKRRSPSRGILRAGLRPGAIMPRAYARAGAAAISVLTEPTFFDGSLGAPARGARRGRHAAPAQGLHRRPSTRSSKRSLLGADAVLLIVAALEPGASADAARRMPKRRGLAALVEVHDAGELGSRARRRRRDRSA